MSGTVLGTLHVCLHCFFTLPSFGGWTETQGQESLRVATQLGSGVSKVREVCLISHGGIEMPVRMLRS